MNNIPLYTECNTSQCWNCAHQISSIIKFVPIKITLGKVRRRVVLPICEVADLAMLYVNKLPCEKFIVKEINKNE